jgi:uncharacterized membrane protein YhhN
LNQATASLSALVHRVDDLPATAWVLLVLSFLAALGHFITGRWQPHPASVIVKGLACGLLVPLVAVSTGLEEGGVLLALALLASTAGDVFLALEKKGFFVHGLVAFLAGHLTYIALFLSDLLPIAGIGAERWIAMIMIPALALGLGRWMWPTLGPMQAPVALYTAAIAAMGTAAALSAFPAGLVLTGALLFVASDSILAVNRFKMPIPASGFFVWTTYYGAQVLITLGVVSASPATH